MAGEMKIEISQEFVSGLADALEQLDQNFSAASCVQAVLDANLDALELKARLQCVATALGACFKDDYPHAIDVLQQVACRYSGLQALVFPEFVQQFGLEHWEVSMGALAAFTSLCSSEFAVRPFIRLDQDAMIAQMLLWADSEDLHQRRLASEGCRPRLPWASPLRRFIADPKPILPILEKLKNDPEEYVRRSVANNLNDISKDHPELALQLGSDWIDPSDYTHGVVKHGLRTLLKRGETRALQLFGYDAPENVEVTNLHFINGTMKIGDTGEFVFDLVVKGTKRSKLRLEYAIGYLKANGKTSRKVFQAGEHLLEPGCHRMTRKQSFRQMSTRKHYPGNHWLAVVVNGREMVRLEFALLPE